MFYLTLFLLISVNSEPVNEFSLKLLSAIHAFDGSSLDNYVVSPQSVWKTLSLLAVGASGSTGDELVMHLKIPPEQNDIRRLVSKVQDLLSINTKSVKLKKSAALFVDRELNIDEHYCKIARGYDTDIFALTDNIAKTAEDINYYVCKATDGKITNIINERSLQNIKLLIVDALYFKGDWTFKFDPRLTKLSSFYDQRGKKIGEVNMMERSMPVKYATSELIQADICELPYGKGEASMIVILPNAPIEKVLENLSAFPEEINEQLRETEEEIKDVSFPKFEISTQLSLVKYLKYLGFIEIFSEDAKLTGISDKPLSVSDVIQKASLEVNEEGSVASVATVAMIESRFGGDAVKINRPFIYLIVEKRENVILFAGVFQKPE